MLERLKQLHPQSIDLSLGRIERLLAALDHPERKLPPVVHVAGTNGKGSFLAFTRAIAEGKDVCFIGTKRQAKTVVETRVTDVGMHYVTERWLGGTLTNFRTIRSRLKRLEELEAIETADNFASYSKKMESQLRREKDKIFRNLSGIRNMDKLPGAIVAVDVKHEINALREARKLGIPTICLIDTGSSLIPSTQAVSQGAGQTRPVNSGKLFVACKRASASRQRSRYTRSFQSGMMFPNGQPVWQNGTPQSMHRAPWRRISSGGSTRRNSW